MNPLYLVVTATISVSYAFMLPVASNTNAMVFGYGLLKVIDMVTLNNICVVCLLCTVASISAFL